MHPSLRRSALLFTALVGLGCGRSSGAVGAALLNTVIAAGASTASRHSGGCYAACPPGTTCNAKTGFCDTLPCRGECGPNEQCVEDGRGSRCMAASVASGPFTVQPAPPPGK